MTNEFIGTIPLADMLQALRLELLEATRRSGGPLELGVEKIEVELQIQVQKATKGEGGVKFWVLTAGGAHTATKSTVHKLKLDLKPSLDQSPLQVSEEAGERPE